MPSIGDVLTVLSTTPTGDGEIVGIQDMDWQPPPAGVATGLPNTFQHTDAAANIYTASMTAILNNGSTVWGVMFYASKAMVCSGVRFYWKTSGSARTINCELWTVTGPTTGTLVTGKTVNVNATGIYTATFTASQTIPANSRFIVSCFGTDDYTAGFHGPGNPSFADPIFGPGVSTTPGNPKMIGPYLTVLGHRCTFLSGDVFPNQPASALGDVMYAVDPILDPIAL